jgi:hypothetical protein
MWVARGGATAVKGAHINANQMGGMFLQAESSKDTVLMK